MHLGKKIKGRGKKIKSQSIIYTPAFQTQREFYQRSSLCPSDCSPCPSFCPIYLPIISMSQLSVSVRYKTFPSASPYRSSSTQPYAHIAPSIVTLATLGNFCFLSLFVAIFTLELYPCPRGCRRYSLHLLPENPHLIRGIQLYFYPRLALSPQPYPFT